MPGVCAVDQHADWFNSVKMTDTHTPHDIRPRAGQRPSPCPSAPPPTVNPSPRTSPPRCGCGGWVTGVERTSSPSARRRLSRHGVEIMDRDGRGGFTLGVTRSICMEH
eukprot:scaffold11044_cov113-Isochrysis_galbana.AAC.2